MWNSNRAQALRLLVIPFVALLASCEHNAPTAPLDGALAAIVVTPNPGGAVVSGTIQFTATAMARRSRASGKARKGMRGRTDASSSGASVSSRGAASRRPSPPHLASCDGSPV
jgi:hypothetical protein